MGREVSIALAAAWIPVSVVDLIGDQTPIEPNVIILAHDATPETRTGYSEVASVRIGTRVFVGANATILPGVAIDDDSIVPEGQRRAPRRAAGCSDARRRDSGCSTSSGTAPANVE